MSNEPALSNPYILPEKPVIPSISDDTSPHYLKRVGRPLRPVKYIPVKDLVFFSKNKDPVFSYDNVIKYSNIGPKQLVIQVKSVGLNPVDLKIINSYTSNFNKERGIGREYSGIISFLGTDMKNEWNVGDEVCGIYFHPNSKGTLSSSILIDPKIDPIILKPTSLNWNEASSWLFTFGSAWQILEKVKKQLKPESLVFINGGSSSVALMAIQLLKNDFKVEKIVASASHNATKLVEKAGAKLVINYRLAQNKDLPHVLKVLTTTGIYKDINDNGEPVENYFSNQGEKFDLILDFVGGYEIAANAGEYLKSGGQFITTTGDKPADYHKDVYNSWNSPYSIARAAFGPIWGVNYIRFEFNPKPAEWIKLGANALETNEITNYIDKVYQWKQWKDAFHYLGQGHAHGKIVLEVEDF